MNFRFQEPIRVRWAECDPQGIVFNAQYLAYLDHAVTGYWRALGLPYPEGLAALNADVVLRSAALDFAAPARFDEQLSFGMRVHELGRTSVTLQGQLHRGRQRLLGAEARYVLIERGSLQSRSIPAPLREALQAYDAGETMTSVRVGAWADLGPDAQPIRQRVFVTEQGISPELEWDDADAICTHAVAYNRLGQALATGRLLEHVPGTAKIGRMAVLPALRGTGVGAQVLAALMDTARQQGYRQVLLHAQASAAGFYRRMGFVQRGPSFDEVGIEHMEMTRGL